MFGKVLRPILATELSGKAATLLIGLVNLLVYYVQPNTALQLISTNEDVDISRVQQWPNNMMAIRDYIQKEMASEKNVREKLDEIHQTLTSFEKLLNNMEVITIDDQFLKTQIIEWEDTIRITLTKAKFYLQSNSDNYEQEFVKTIQDKNLDTTLLRFLDRFVNNETSGISILSSFQDVTKCHRRKFVKMARRPLPLIALGLGTLGLYYEINQTPINDRTIMWDEIKKKVDLIRDKIDSIENDCIKEDNVEAEIRALMRNSQTNNIDKQEFVDHVYKFLIDKYDTKYWAVKSYEPHPNLNEESIDVGFKTIFKEGKKNVVVLSVQSIGGCSKKETSDRIEDFCYLKTNYDQQHSLWKEYDLTQRCEHYLAGAISQELRKSHVDNDTKLAISWGSSNSLATSRELCFLDKLYRGIHNKNLKLNILAVLTTSKYFHIKSKMNDKFILDVDNSTGSVLLRKYQADGIDSQMWHIDDKYGLRSKTTGHCIISQDYGGFLTGPCDGSQKWFLRDKQIYNLDDPSKCLDLFLNQNCNQVQVVESNCNESINQQWGILTDI